MRLLRLSSLPFLIALSSSAAAQPVTIGGLAIGDNAAHVDSVLRRHALVATPASDAAGTPLADLDSGTTETLWRVDTASGLDRWLEIGCIAPMAGTGTDEHGDQICASTEEAEVHFVGDRLRSMRLVSRALPASADSVRLHAINLFIHLRGIAAAGPTEEYQSPWGIGSVQLSEMGDLMPIARWRVRRGKEVEVMLAVERGEERGFVVVVEMGEAG